MLLRCKELAELSVGCGELPEMVDKPLVSAAHPSLRTMNISNAPLDDDNIMQLGFLAPTLESANFSCSLRHVTPSVLVDFVTAMENLTKLTYSEFDDEHPDWLAAQRVIKSRLISPDQRISHTGEVWSLSDPADKVERLSRSLWFHELL
jgi:hypothetical protein